MATFKGPFKFIGRIGNIRYYQVPGDDRTYAAERGKVPESFLKQVRFSKTPGKPVLNLLLNRDARKMSGLLWATGHNLSLTANCTVSW